MSKIAEQNEPEIAVHKSHSLAKHAKMIRGHPALTQSHRRKEQGEPSSEKFRKIRPEVEFVLVEEASLDSGQRRSRRSSFNSSSSPRIELSSNRESILSPTDPTKELHVSSPTKKLLREISGGNILIDTILNRIRFDSSLLKSEKFTVLVEDTACDAKLCFKHLAGLDCYYRERCKYIHSSMQLVVFGSQLRGIIPPGGHSPLLQRLPALSILDSVNVHEIAYVEYSGKIVWARDGGRHSRELWENFTHRLNLKISSTDDADDASVMSQQPYNLKNVHADAWLRIFSCLNCVDARNALIALSASSVLRPSILDPSIWCERAFSSFGERRARAARFGFLTQAAVHAHASLISSLARFGETDPPKFCLPGLRELGPNASYARSAQVTVEFPICDISVSSRLLACACVGELHLFNDWTKVAVARKPRAFERVVLPHWASARVVHAGSAGLFWSDLDDAAMPVTGRAVWGEAGQLTGLVTPDRHRVLVGVEGLPAKLIDSESGKNSGKIGLDVSRFSRFDENRVLVKSKNHGLQIWDIRGEALMGDLIFPGSRGELFCMDSADCTVVAGCSDGVLVFDTRKAGLIVDKLKMEITPRFLSLSSRALTAWTAEGGEVRVWDSDAFSLFGASALNVDVTCVAHASSLSLAFGARRPRKFNRGDASILCLVTEPVDIDDVVMQTPATKKQGKRR